MQQINRLVAQLGIDHRARALSTTGLALTVIPEVRISDLGGLLDVATQEFIPLFYER
ncbi:MAG: hypothetical protein KDE58_41635 [Caldilineaceae bacterium]|nr:hypothetical protein [Caldilineaceae bacterium]